MITLSCLYANQRSVSNYFRAKDDPKKIKPALIGRVTEHPVDVGQLGLLDIRCLLALLALHNFERNLVALFQGFEAVHVDV